MIIQPSGKKYYPQLDGLRAVAVLAVFVSHWVPLNIVKKIGFGFWGVNLFFVLSGFLITEILLREIGKNKPAWQLLKSFFYKRILRIFPIYYLVIIFAFVLNLDNSRDFSLYTFTYTLNFYNAFTGNIGLYLSHMWSLCVEEQFYLIWPFLLIFIKPKFHLHLILATILGAILLRYLLYYTEFPNYSIYNYRSMPASMDALGLGGLMAYLKIFKPALLKTILNYSFITIIAMVAYLLIVFTNNQYSTILNETFLRTLVSIFSFFIIANALTGYKNWVGTFLESKWMQFLGRISYGLYLYHLIISTFLISALEAFIKESILPYLPDIFNYNIYILSAPVYFLLTVITATISFYLIEKPFLKLKEKQDFKWIPKLNSA